MKPATLIVRAIVFCLLTIITQTGGLIYLLHFWVCSNFVPAAGPLYRRRLVHAGVFTALYLGITFLIVPLVARPLGRVPLPITTTGHLRPANVFTCILGRNYVRPQLRALAFDAAGRMAVAYPGTVINYLDAGFPFINKFPLLPHLSHNDGRKLDLSFCYNSAASGEETNIVPSLIGYGICEEPAPGEVNTAAACGRQGYWQYNMLRRVVPQGSKKNFVFNADKTRALADFLIKEVGVEKIFIEPHLKVRLGLRSPKVRFQGCHAVRHDDHIHVQCW